MQGRDRPEQQTDKWCRLIRRLVGHPRNVKPMHLAIIQVKQNAYKWLGLGLPPEHVGGNYLDPDCPGVTDDGIQTPSQASRQNATALKLKLKSKTLLASGDNKSAMQFANASLIEPTGETIGG
uniref:HDC02651 n=1 Tax=Drosophila melanogaster TaxID=7227 RepID=Q6IHF5_DROME|nr:TPA_inf: HDC02651 [Drosophila melanogaster]